MCLDAVFRQKKWEKMWRQVGIEPTPVPSCLQLLKKNQEKKDDLGGNRTPTFCLGSRCSSNMLKLILVKEGGKVHTKEYVYIKKKNLNQIYFSHDFRTSSHSSWIEVQTLNVKVGVQSLLKSKIVLVSDCQFEE